jgi:hypothetical protein
MREKHKKMSQPAEPLGVTDPVAPDRRQETFTAPDNFTTRTIFTNSSSSSSQAGALPPSRLASQELNSRLTAHSCAQIKNSSGTVKSREKPSRTQIPRKKHS